MQTLVRKPTVTQRQIQELVGKQIVNPETDEPYALGTINNDIQAIRQIWQEKAEQGYGVWVAEELARVAEVEEEAWERDDLDIVLKCSDRRRKLLGLDQPMKADITSGGEELLPVAKLIAALRAADSELSDDAG